MQKARCDIFISSLSNVPASVVQDILDKLAKEEAKEEEGDICEKCQFFGTLDEEILCESCKEVE